jgi:hypothetical protein
MAGLWCMLVDRGQDGYCHVPHQDLVHLYFISDNGFPIDHLFHFGLLDEHKKVYSVRPQKPLEIPLI